MSTYYLSRGDETMIFHRTHVTDHGRKPITDSWRPVVVIDPEDREAVRRLYEALLDEAVDDLSLSPNRMSLALREFANPTPPKPDEPTGLGAVVEDRDGLRYVRVSTNSLPWVQSNDDGLAHDYADIAVARVLSEGVAR